MGKNIHDELQLLGLLAKHFFSAIPKTYLTYCTLTASVSQKVLTYFGHQADLLPCQAWYATTQRQNYLVGFVGKGSTTEKWDGHVVCATPSHIIDAALHHFEREFHVPAPHVAVVARITIPTQVIARLDQEDGARIGWINPPPAIDATIPPAPLVVVDELATRLIAAIEAG